ncbi:hypothetical protein [Chitinophaga eiseniae]|uniref:Uncharacterized protein n=1 Tax=Chitinophaga eiseniae TaxID=634771 RepID=A0A847SQF6_9BACT|nr:hypothetical protein [Chitinophaga eiseniae]NLR82253.1 hypothetical protein [Chitinophaga eiseniae]
MAKQKNNRYHQAALKQKVKEHLQARLHTKGLAFNSAKETGKDLLIGVLGGGLVAALLGRYSLLAGLGVTYLGHYTGNPITSSFGLGMMASPNLVGGAVNGLDGLDGVKERVQAFKENMMQRTFLDKVIKKKETVNGTVGEIQYFDYGQMNGSDNPELYGDLAVENGHPELMGALNDIDNAIADAGMMRLQGTGVGALALDTDNVGAAPDMDSMGYADVADYNF